MPIVSAAGWFGYFLRIYGTLDPSAPYGGYTQTAWAHVPAGVAGLLLDAQFGVLGVAPVFALALIGLAWMLRRRRRRRTPAPAGSRSRLAGSSRVAIVVAFVGYTVASASYRMWWGGASAPARFLVPMLLPLALPIGVAWSRTRGVASRALALAALARHRRRHADPRRRRRRAAGLRQPHRGGRLDAMGEPGGRSRARAARRPSQHAGRGGGAGRWSGPARRRWRGW